MSFFLPQGPFIRVATGGVLNSSVLTTVPGLSMAVDRGTYLVRCSIWAINANAVTAKPGVTLTSNVGSTCFLTVQNIDNSNDQENLVAYATETINQGILASQDNGLLIEGTIVVAKAGTFNIQLNTGEEACTIYPSSQMTLYKVA